jgi:hypothetical protein
VDTKIGVNADIQNYKNKVFKRPYPLGLTSVENSITA